MFFGFPLRTTNTIVDVYGSDRFGYRFSQSGSRSPALATAFVSVHRASEITSPGSPSITARAWLPEPPCDWRMNTLVPVSRS